MSSLVPSATSPALPLSEYLKLPTAPETWLIEPLIPAGGIVNLYSAPKVGKSYLALDMCRALAAGESEWLGHFHIEKAASVLYIQLDTPRSLWIKRFQDLEESGVTFNSKNFFLADMGQTPYPFVMNSDVCISYLRGECDRINPSLVVIDTTREAHQGNENDSEQMQKVISSLVVATRPAACLLISHSRKEIKTSEGEAQEASLMNDNRGSGYVSGRVDAQIQLRGAEGKPTATMVYQGRAVEHGMIRLTKGENVLWQANINPLVKIAQNYLAQEFPSMRQRAKAMAEETHNSLPKCLSMLNRLHKKQKESESSKGDS